MRPHSVSRMENTQMNMRRDDSRLSLAAHHEHPTAQPKPSEMLRPLRFEQPGTVGREELIGRSWLFEEVSHAPSAWSSLPLLTGCAVDVRIRISRFTRGWNQRGVFPWSAMLAVAKRRLFMSWCSRWRGDRGQSTSFINRNKYRVDSCPKCQVQCHFTSCQHHNTKLVNGTS